MPCGAGFGQPLIDVRLDEAQRTVLPTEANRRNAPGPGRVVDPGARTESLRATSFGLSSAGLVAGIDDSNETGQFDGAGTGTPIQRLTEALDVIR